jgi:plastocyanin
MRPSLIATIAAVAVAAMACNDYTTASTTANACAGSGAAATVNATDGLSFSPAGVTIAHGQAVCWQNTGSVTHTVTSNDGTSFDSNLPGGQTFVHTFSTPGSFAYRCTIHAGMTGTITVN